MISVPLSESTLWSDNVSSASGNILLQPGPWCACTLARRHKQLNWFFCTACFLDHSNYVLDGDPNPTKNGGATPQSGTWNCRFGWQLTVHPVKTDEAMKLSFCTARFLDHSNYALEDHPNQLQNRGATPGVGLWIFRVG